MAEPTSASLPGQPGWRARLLHRITGRAGTAGPPVPIRDRLLRLAARVRALVRTDEIWLVVLAAVAGAAAGLCVTGMSLTFQRLHELLFGLERHQRLSGVASLDPLRLILVLVAGGLLVGLTGLAIMRWRPTRVVDPIEANALHGGRMSLSDSLIVVFQTMLSTGFGASVGLEAGYTQIGSALASELGTRFRLRRNDQRLLVGCGAAGAIAAAFNAPLAGAFYAFELIIGTYTLATLAPVIAAAIVATLVARLLSPGMFGFDIPLPAEIPPVGYLPVVCLGVVAAFAGIAIMYGVTLTEQAVRAMRLPPWLRPAVGGLAVALLAMTTPKVLSAGHAAMASGLDSTGPLREVALLFLLKAAAASISLGAGFRGGLFFASLFLGSLLGKLFAGGLAMVTTVTGVPDTAMALVGMSSLAVAIVGGPLTMAFLMLESTGSLPLTIAVLLGAVVTSVTVRRIFGYSFATWRFHLRGEAIRGAVDIGWMRDLTVERMMRREVPRAPADLSLASFRRRFPLGAADRVVLTDAQDRYAGIVLVAEAHAAGRDATAAVGTLLRQRDAMLTPAMTIKQAIAAFETAEADALVVVDEEAARRVIGLLTEAYALRRYSEELDSQRKDLSGE
jgi:CIC family chloride channel protein